MAIGAPLGLYVARRPLRSAGIFAVLNIVQTIPSIALFGLLIAPLGSRAAAWRAGHPRHRSPALIALFLYSLLPVVRNTRGRPRRRRSRPSIERRAAWA